jgi:Flp pilus assembly protein TadB
MVSPCKALRDAVVGIGQATGEMMPVRRILFTTLCVGVVVGFGCWVMPQTVAAGVSGVSAACTTLAVQTGNWLNRAARRFGLVM